MPKYTASQAAEGSQKTMKYVIIRPLIEQIDAKIENAMNQGKRVIYHPFANLSKDGKPYCPTAEEEKTILNEYQQAGYTTQYHPDPDPGHPMSGDYYTIEW